jgi:hypothetical protein
MSPGKDYHYCLYCGATNITYRQYCWHCGAELLYYLNSRHQATLAMPPDGPSPEEIERLLDQATLIDLVPPKPPRERILRRLLDKAARSLHFPHLRRLA